ncbi:SLAP domain-containing protein, partial [Companilactobacillus nantensis]
VVTYKDKNSNIIDTQNPIKLIGITNNDKKLTLKNPDGTTTKWNIPAGHYGDSPVTLTAKALPGYKAPSVIVTYNASGIPTITNANDTTKPLTETDELSYTRNPSHDGSSAVNPTTTGEGVIESKPQTVSTYSDKPDVELYQLGADNKMSPITSRSLATASNWYSDATITVDGISYFRVATNEWAKVGEVYPYQALNLHIRTYDDSEKDLYKAENVLITKETLAPSSSWITDRETYVINNTKYYRVATNEFVNADDVYVYSPVNMVVTTHADKYTTLYTAKGAEVTNRTLSNDSSWKVDSITYINGDKYYRVATNEFVKASDVDIRNYR